MSEFWARLPLPARIIAAHAPHATPPEAASSRPATTPESIHITRLSRGNYPAGPTRLMLG